MGFSRGPKIVTDGLVLALDAGSKKSYPGSGTNITDLSGNGNNGTLTNGPTFNSNGYWNFDGVNDRIATPVLYDTWHSHSWTLDAWLKYDNVQSDDGFFEMSRVNVSGNWGISTVTRTGKFYFYWVGSATSGHTLNSSEISNGNLFNISITFNAPGGTPSQSDLYNNTITYINGQLISHTSGGGAGISSAGQLTIGSVQYPFQGNIYSFKYYERVLSPNEILQNYNTTKSRFI
jgi:hypothetical protein